MKRLFADMAFHDMRALLEYCREHSMRSDTRWHTTDGQQGTGPIGSMPRKPPQQELKNKRSPGGNTPFQIFCREDSIDDFMLNAEDLDPYAGNDFADEFLKAALRESEDEFRGKEYKRLKILADDLEETMKRRFYFFHVSKSKIHNMISLKGRHGELSKEFTENSLLLKYKSKRAEHFLTSVIRPEYLQNTMLKIGKLKSDDYFGDDRSYYNPIEGKVSMEPGAATRSFIHEFAHALETDNPTIKIIFSAFRDYRTKGEEPVSLQELTGDKGYLPSEIAKPDHFFHPYCGKIYPDGDTNELFSMGLEMLYYAPWRFYQADREYFKLVLFICEMPYCQFKGQISK